MHEGKIILYTYDPLLGVAINHLVHTFRDFNGNLRLPNDITIIDNRLSNHAFRAISELTVARRRGVIWLMFEHFYSYKPKEHDHFIDAQLPLNELADELAESIYRLARFKEQSPRKLNLDVLDPLTPRERVALGSTINVRSPSLPAFAKKLDRSPKTLYAQRRAAVAKLGFSSVRKFVIWIASKEGQSLNKNTLLRHVIPAVSVAASYTVHPVESPFKPLTGLTNGAGGGANRNDRRGQRPADC